MTSKFLYQPIRTIKAPLILVVGGFLLFFGLLIGNSALAWTDNFEAYETGSDLNGQGGWVANPDRVKITEAKAHSGIKSAYTYYTTTNYSWWKIDEEVVEGYAKFWVLTVFSTDPDALVITITNYDAGKRTAYLEFAYDKKVNYYISTTKYQLGTFASNTWYVLEVEWVASTKLVRYRFNGGNWTGWVANRDDTDVPPDTMNFLYGRWQGLNYWYLDDAELKGVCSSTNCGACSTWQNCQAIENCFWDFQYNWCLPYEWCCGCGSPHEKCLFCETENTCEEIEGCYWLENFCYYSTAVCGAGLELQFCLTQETCENAGGYWYDDYCWEEEKPVISSWVNWYDSYGDYEEPSPFINTLATSTQNFFESVGGFLITFKKSFDLKSAYQYGKDFGETIPTARGYLLFLNSFVGYLPVGTFFMFVMIFMLAVGVFRIVRALIQLIKFW